MSYSADTVVILGLGLIGGSLARALRKSGYSKRFIGWGHRETSLRRGVELGVIDDFTLDLDDAIGQADILVVCTPTLIAADMLRDILPRLAGMANAPVITTWPASRATCVMQLLQPWDRCRRNWYWRIPSPDRKKAA